MGLGSVLAVAKKAVYEALLGAWLRELYMDGPRAFGCWGGLSHAEVCARLTPASEARDWIDVGNVPSAACVAMVERSYHSFVVCVHVLLYMALIWMVWSATCQWRNRRNIATAITRAMTEAVVHRESLHCLPDAIPALMDHLNDMAIAKRTRSMTRRP